MKRVKRGRTKKKDTTIKCNRPGWRKKVIGRIGRVKNYRRGNKIKSREWEKVK